MITRHDEIYLTSQAFCCKMPGTSDISGGIRPGDGGNGGAQSSVPHTTSRLADAQRSLEQRQCTVAVARRGAMDVAMQHGCCGDVRAEPTGRISRLELSHADHPLPVACATAAVAPAAAPAARSPNTHPWLAAPRPRPRPPPVARAAAAAVLAATSTACDRGAHCPRQMRPISAPPAASCARCNRRCRSCRRCGRTQSPRALPRPLASHP